MARPTCTRIIPHAYLHLDDMKWIILRTCIIMHKFGMWITSPMPCEGAVWNGRQPINAQWISIILHVYRQAHASMSCMYLRTFVCIRESNTPVETRPLKCVKISCIRPNAWQPVHYLTGVAAYARAPPPTSVMYSVGALQLVAISGRPIAMASTCGLRSSVVHCIVL